MGRSISRFIAIGVKRPFDVSVQRSQHSDPRVHQRPAIFRRHDQRFAGRLPFRKVSLGFGQFHNVAGGVRRVTS
jgi:hypothetical protein